jgi:hypothetical protein
LIAEIISSAETIVNCHSADGILKDTHGVDAELFRKFKILERRLGLLLNSNEDDHKLLMATVSALVVDMIHGVNDYRKFHENIETIMITSQRILKAEWVRVKKGAL